MSRDNDSGRDDRPSKQRGSGTLIGVLAGLGVLICCCGVLGLPVVQMARDAARRTQAMNNLKQISLALHNYRDGHRAFPRADGQTPDGKPGLSWRVHILPYIEEVELYKQFHLDEAWDSPHNLALLDSMPATYAFGTPRPRQNTTSFRVFIGGGAAFEHGQAITVKEFPDGTSNTILVVEAAEEVPWTKPEELEYSPTDPLPKLGNPARAGFLVLMADGTVRFFQSSISEQLLRATITRAGGEGIAPDF